jgi:hypothetical protein
MHNAGIPAGVQVSVRVQHLVTVILRGRAGGVRIRQKRLDLKLEQKDAAQVIQVSESAI